VGIARVLLTFHSSFKTILYKDSPETWHCIFEKLIEYSHKVCAKVILITKYDEDVMATYELSIQLTAINAVA
jgi:hypothetical protein